MQTPASLETRSQPLRGVLSNAPATNKSFQDTSHHSLVLVINLSHSDSNRTDDVSILDVDANGEVDALTDGLLLLRSMFKLTDDALVTGVVDSANCKECDAEGIDSYITSIKGTTYGGLTPEPGPAGPQGEKGDKGDTGSQGIQGIKGDTGSQGIAGTDGANGDTGAQGVQGATGAQMPEKTRCKELLLSPLLINHSLNTVASLEVYWSIDRLPRHLIR